MIGPMAPLPDRVRLVILDLDGVVYRGHQPIAGASELVAWLHDAGVVVRFATNNSMVTRAGYAERLAAFGIHATAEEVVTSTSATVEHLRHHAPDVHRVLAIGAEGMREELSSAGLDVTMAGDLAPDPSGAPLEGYDAVVVGLDPHLDYGRMSAAMAAVEGGARFVATNADARYPTPAGFAPGAGAIVNALATATGVEPEVIGKPEPAMFTSILESTGVPRGSAVVIGDNPAADVSGANRSGIAAILVLTGVADRAMADALTGDLAPSAVADDPAAIRALLAGRVS
jgi:4-nitrophenyl phosphatase